MHIRYSRRKLRRAGISALALGLAFGAPTGALLTPAFAQSSAPIQVLVNGRAIVFSGAQPTQVGGRVLVPLRGVFEALGATVDYDAQTNTALAARGTTQVQLRIGSTQAFVNGQLRTLDVPAQARLGRTLVPLRFVLEALGVPVQWDAARNTVLITNSGNNSGVDNGGVILPPDDNGGYIPPQTGAQTISGTVIGSDAAGTSVTLRDASGQTRTYFLTPGARVLRQTTGLISSGVTPRYGSALALSDTSRLVAGEEVRFRVNNNNEILDITAQASLVVARVLSVQGSRIVLDDARNTTLNIGPNLRFIDTRGRSTSVANVQAGQSVALFVTPTQRRIYQVSALQDDLDIASGTNNNTPGDTTYPPINDNPNQPPAGSLNITLVQHNANRALRAGATVSVTVRGTPRLTGTFNVVPDGNEIPLDEDNNRPGVYTGTYVVRPGDNVLNGRVTAYLRDAQGRESLVQSQAPLTIDTMPPRITSTSPQNGASVNNDQPNIVINATDIGGSGLASATVTVNGQRLDDTQISVSPNSVRFTPDEPLNGQTAVRATVVDEAGNQASTNFSFDAGRGRDGGTGGNNGDSSISSISHNATRALSSGDRVTVSMRAPAGGRATFNVIGESGRIVRNNVPMTEDTPGRYIGSYTIPNNISDSELLIRGRFTDENGQASTADASSSVLLSGGLDSGNALGEVNITSPAEGTRVDSPLVVRGTATPNSTVEVSVRAEGTRYLLFEYRQELGGTRQVQANGRGNWTSDPFDLPQPRNVSALRYIVTAVQIDAAGRRSEPVTVTVNGRN